MRFFPIVGWKTSGGETPLSPSDRNIRLRGRGRTLGAPRKCSYCFPSGLVPLASAIRSSRSAKSNNSCWTSAILACRASCLTLSAISR